MRPSKSVHRRISLRMMVSILGAAALAAVAHAEDGAKKNLSLAEPFEVSSSPFGNYMSALVAEHEHDSLAASTFFQEALRYDPNNYDLMDQGFVAALSNGDIDAAQAMAQKLVVHDQSNGLARLVQGIWNLKNKRYISARSAFVSISPKDSADLVTTMMTAWSLAGAGKYADALRRIDQLQNPAVSAFRDFHAGLIAQMAKDPKEAEKRLGAAYAASKSTLRVVDAYARFLDQQGKSDAAIKVYKDFEVVAPHNAIADRALKQLAAGQKLAPLVATAQQGAAEALYGLGIAGARQDDQTTAIIYLRLALFLQPDHDLALITLANYYGRLKQYGTSVDLYNQVPANDPLRTEADVQTALAFDAADHKKQALAQLADIVKAHPDNREALEAYGNLQRTAKDFTGSVASFTTIINMDKPPVSTNWPDYYSRGVAYAGANQWPQAEADFKEALKLSPDEPAVLNYLGYSWVDRGENLDEAFRMLRKAVDEQPEDGYIVDSLGWALFKLGRYAEATKELKKAVALKPADPLINEHLGDAFWRTGDKLEAQFQWNHARDSKPEPKDLARILDKIKNGLPAATPAEAVAAPAKSGG